MGDAHQRGSGAGLAREGCCVLPRPDGQLPWVGLSFPAHWWVKATSWGPHLTGLKGWSLGKPASAVSCRGFFVVVFFEIKL